jgi:uncharacterized protein
MSGASVPPAASAPPALAPAPVDPKLRQLNLILESLGELADDGSVPRNVRRGAQSARDELAKPRVALDVRISSAVQLLDELANNPNLPNYGRTAIWSIISNLESVR